MFGLHIDDIIYTALGLAGLGALAVIAQRSKRACDALAKIAQLCQDRHAVNDIERNKPER